MKLKKFLPKILNKDRKVFYITNDSNIEYGKDRFDLILSPTFYWVKKEQISVKRESDALKFAQSIFEGQFEDIENYKYIAIKYSDSEYIYIAYNPKQILERLKDDFSITENMIGNIYTAQSEFIDIKEPILSISTTKMVISIDGVISELLKHSHTSSVDYKFLNQTPRSRFNLKYRGVNGDEVNLFIASILPLALVIYFSLDIMKLNRDIQSLNIEIEKRRDIYQLPSTSFQIKSIKNRYLEIEKKQFEIRDSISWLQKEKFSRYGKLDYLIANKKELKFKLELKKGKNSNKVKSILQKRDKDVEFNQNENILEVTFKR